MKISITYTHISLARRDDPQYDAVALAIREATGLEPHVGADSVIINGSKHYLPMSVQKFIEAFDDGRRVGPIEFELGVR